MHELHTYGEEEGSRIAAARELYEETGATPPPLALSCTPPRCVPEATCDAPATSHAALCCVAEATPDAGFALLYPPASHHACVLLAMHC